MIPTPACCLSPLTRDMILALEPELCFEVSPTKCSQYFLLTHALGQAPSHQKGGTKHGTLHHCHLFQGHCASIVVCSDATFQTYAMLPFYFWR